MIPYLVSQKIVVSGSFVEHYAYEKPYWVGFPRFRRQPRFRAFQRPKTPQLQLRDDNVRRTRSKIRRLVNSNRDLVKFMTLTFSSSVVDLNLSNPLFKDFILRVKYRFPDFKYLCVPEFQKRGRVHYHLLCNLPFIENSIITNLWSHGFVFLRKIDRIDNVGAYVCKYLGKANFDVRYFKKNKFFYSLNLTRPQVVDNYDDVQYVMGNLPVDNPLFVQKLHEFECCTEYLGVIKYNQYKAESFVKVVPSCVNSRAEGIARKENNICQKQKSNLEFLFGDDLSTRKLPAKKQKAEVILRQGRLPLM